MKSLSLGHPLCTPTSSLCPNCPRHSYSTISLLWKHSRYKTTYLSPHCSTLKLKLTVPSRELISPETQGGKLSVQIRARCSLRKLTPALHVTLAILKSNIQNQNESLVTFSAQVRNEKKHFRLWRENYSEDSTTISCRLPKGSFRLFFKAFVLSKEKKKRKVCLFPLPPQYYKNC